MVHSRGGRAGFGAKAMTRAFRWFVRVVRVRMFLENKFILGVVIWSEIWYNMWLCEF